jgi:hypothetical protein
MYSWQLRWEPLNAHVNPIWVITEKSNAAVVHGANMAKVFRFLFWCAKSALLPPLRATKHSHPQNGPEYGEQ